MAAELRRSSSQIHPVFEEELAGMAEEMKWVARGKERGRRRQLGGGPLRRLSLNNWVAVSLSLPLLPSAGSLLRLALVCSTDEVLEERHAQLMRRHDEQQQVR